MNHLFPSFLLQLRWTSVPFHRRCSVFLLSNTSPFFGSEKRREVQNPNIRQRAAAMKEYGNRKEIPAPHGNMEPQTRKLHGSFGASSDKYKPEEETSQNGFSRGGHLILILLQDCPLTLKSEHMQHTFLRAGLQTYPDPLQQVQLLEEAIYCKVGPPTEF
ncbi:hypothetical protein Cni_G10187 [Canna indica]|uniref:Uncharacterized protein n=1 Tax=Canna indica TaxID=4628 RepID=A0AAQ3Q9N4_9LILI|nr:hypothetical protein Cni_G10187 [Canna indica]